MVLVVIDKLLLLVYIRNLLLQKSFNALNSIVDSTVLYKL